MRGFRLLSGAGGGGGGVTGTKLSSSIIQTRGGTRGKRERFRARWRGGKNWEADVPGGAPAPVEKRNRIGGGERGAKTGIPLTGRFKIFRGRFFRECGSASFGGHVKPRGKGLGGRRFPNNWAGTDGHPSGNKKRPGKGGKNQTKGHLGGGDQQKRQKLGSTAKGLGGELKIPVRGRSGARHPANEILWEAAGVASSFLLSKKNPNLAPVALGGRLG